MAKKKLLVFSTQLLETGGIESHIKEFLAQMAATGLYETDLVVLNARLSLQQKKQLEDFCRWVYMPGSKGILNKFSFLVIMIRGLFRKYDALYTNGQGNSISLIKKVFNYKKWIHHHHTSGDLADQQTWTDNYKQSLKQADVVVACSTKNAGYMMPVLGREVITIPCFSKKIDIVKSRKSEDEKIGKIELGYYGRLIPEKGIDLLCKLSNDPDMENIRFHIWGEGQRYDKVFFESYPQLIYHGKFNGQKELEQVLQVIDGYLLLSVHPEGLPISLLELMSAGIPWMSTSKGGISDIAIDPMATRLLESLEPYDELKNKILNFADDIAMGKISSDNQKHLYNTRFAAPVLVTSWSNVLFNNVN